MISPKTIRLLAENMVQFRTNELWNTKGAITRQGILRDSSLLERWKPKNEHFKFLVRIVSDTWPKETDKDVLCQKLNDLEQMEMSLHVKRAKQVTQNTKCTRFDGHCYISYYFEEFVEFYDVTFMGGPAPSLPRSLPQIVCAACLKLPTLDVPLLKCARCQGVYYCNQLCQKSNWKEHKAFCR